MWEIIDENGVIYSGSENEMRDLFFDIKNGGCNAPLDTWQGDLKLIEVHEVTK